MISRLISQGPGAALGAAALGGWLLAVGACGYPKPPAAWTGVEPAPSVAPTPPPPPPVIAAPPPPPPPKCEDLAENCAASADTKLAVGSAGAWFTPPEGWHYAKTPDGSVAVHPDGTAMLMLAPAAIVQPADVAPAAELLVAKQGVTGFKSDKLKRRLKKPQQTLPAGEGSVDLWEVDKSQQGEALSLKDKGNGTLLVMLAKPAADQTLVGIGFVLETVAETEAPKVMQSVQTLRGKQ